LIKSIGIKALAKSIEDFNALVKLLKALGIRVDLEGKNERYQYADFLPDGLALNVIFGTWPGDKYDLFLSVAHPDTAFEVLEKLGFKPVEDITAGKEKKDKPFCVVLPSGTRVGIWGLSNPLITDIKPAPHIQGHTDAAGKRFCLVVSTFNSFITERLAAGAVDVLIRSGAETPTIVRVPGAFEIPSAARTMAESKEYDAIICLGCLLRGDTAHYDVIANEVARGIGQSAQETGVPHAFGVLTCDTLEQAIDRAGLKMGNKGAEAAWAAIEMANLTKFVRTTLFRRKTSRMAKSSVEGRAAATAKKQIPPSRSASRRNDKSKNKPAKNQRTMKKRT
jgi:6,7-dimethyl-8-ribityllumazine synthase